MATTIYVVAPNYDFEGNGDPEYASISEEKAQQYADTFSEPYKTYYVYELELDSSV